MDSCDPQNAAFAATEARILVNLIPPSAGGGLQNAVSLVMGIANHPKLRHEAVVVCPRDGAAHKASKEAGLKVVPMRPGLVGRFYFELGGGALIARRQNAATVFTLFGNAPLVSPGLYRISGVALSNILMPEIAFWQDLPFLRRKIKELKDRLRLRSMRLSQEIIVETDYLAERARNGPLKDRIVHVVRMEPSLTVLKALTNRTPNKRTGELRLLALTSPHPNKRLAAMGPIMARLAALRAAQGEKPPKFLISFDSEHPYAKTVSAAFQAAGAPPPKFLGQIPPTGVVDVLQSVDGLVNIARLESFSNNWVEAWVAGLPLICTDADWARASCGEAAIYVDPAHPDVAAAEIAKGFSSPESTRALASAGYRQLSELSSHGNKLDNYARILETAAARNRR